MPSMRIGLACLVAFSLGCAGYESARKSREEYLRCVDDHPMEPKHCEELKKQANADYNEYEEGALEGWCGDQTDSNQTGCSLHPKGPDHNPRGPDYGD